MVTFMEYYCSSGSTIQNKLWDRYSWNCPFYSFFKFLFKLIFILARPVLERIHTWSLRLCILSPLSPCAPWKVLINSQELLTPSFKRNAQTVVSSPAMSHSRLWCSGRSLFPADDTVFDAFLWFQGCCSSIERFHLRPGLR